jgi:thymidylate synthase
MIEKEKFYFSECHLQDNWKKAILDILMYGDLVADERGQNTKEIQNLIIRTTKPLSSRVPEEFPLKENALERYENEMVKPTLDGFAYTYGNRLRYHFNGAIAPIGGRVQKIDQLAETIIRLDSNMQSRRATMVTWDPAKDSLEDEVPCMIMVDFKIRDGRLNTTGIWRSHDMFGAYVANFIAIRKLAMYVVNELKVNFGRRDLKVGPITTQSISAHIYEHDWDAANAMFKK